MIECCICHKLHDPIYDVKYNQGWGCSSHCTEKYIVGHYGSRLIDMQVWEWVYGCIPKVMKQINAKKEPVVCDICILDLISEGLIKQRNKEYS